MFQHPSPARGFPCSPTPLIAALGAPTSATPLALGTRPHFLGSALVQGMLPMGSDLPWLSRARVRCRGMTHVSSLPIADLAPVVRSREHPVPEREAAAQAGVSHGGSLADLRPGNPGGNPWGAAGEQGAASSVGCLSALPQPAAKPQMWALPPSLPSTAPLGTNRRTPNSW